MLGRSAIAARGPSESSHLPLVTGAGSEKLGFGSGSLLALPALLVLSGPALGFFLLLAPTFFAGGALIITVGHGHVARNRFIINERKL